MISVHSPFASRFRGSKGKRVLFSLQKASHTRTRVPPQAVTGHAGEEDEDLDLQQLEYYEPKGLELTDEQEKPSEEDGALPVYSMAGISSPRTMRLQGIMRGRTVTVLIDSGASHNFISSYLVTTLRLKPDKTGKFGVQLGDGRRQESEGVCRGISVFLPGCEVTTDCYVFALGGVDLILGVAWLATLGDVRTNWETMTMTFAWKERTFELRGDPTLCRRPVGLRVLMQTQNGEFWAVLLEGEPTKLTNAEPTRVEKVL